MWNLKKKEKGENEKIKVKIINGIENCKWQDWEDVVQGQNERKKE